jgi:hypothetical protein
LLQLHEIPTQGDDSEIAHYLIPLAQHFNLSLRQLEKTFTNLAIIYSTSGENHLRLVPIIVFIAVVKVINPNVYGDIVSGKISCSTLFEKLRFSELNEEKKDNHYLADLIEWVRYSMLSESEYDQIDENDKNRQFPQRLRRYDMDRKSLLPMFCQKLSMFNVN